MNVPVISLVQMSFSNKSLLFILLNCLSNPNSMTIAKFTLTHIIYLGMTGRGRRDQTLAYSHSDNF